jgi:hypothetical protein
MHVHAPSIENVCIAMSSFAFEAPFAKITHPSSDFKNTKNKLHCEFSGPVGPPGFGAPPEIALRCPRNVFLKRCVCFLKVRCRRDLTCALYVHRLVEMSADTKEAHSCMLLLHSARRSAMCMFGVACVRGDSLLTIVRLRTR